jgi:hypothetical protein
VQQLLKQLALLEQECFDRRELVWAKVEAWCSQLQANGLGAVVALAAHLKSHLEGWAMQDAMQWATQRLTPTGPEPINGTRTTSILQWSFKEDSFWKGPPDNHRTFRLSKSMLVSGFRADSVIASRTMELKKPLGQVEELAVFALDFGDGSCRGLAAGLCLKLLAEGLDSLPPGDVGLRHLLSGLFNIPTNFETHGQGTARDALIAQVARQNQAAQVLPVNTVEWCDILMKFCGLSLGNIGPRDTLLSQMENFVNAYNHHPEVEAYSGPAPKRRRKSSTAAPKGEDGGDVGLKVGAKRMAAIRNILRHCTPEGFAILKSHLHWVSDWKHAAFNDEVLSKRWFWPGSQLGYDGGAPAAHEVETMQMLPDNLSNRAFDHDPVLSTVRGPVRRQSRRWCSAPQSVALCTWLVRAPRKQSLKKFLKFVV